MRKIIVALAFFAVVTGCTPAVAAIRHSDAQTQIAYYPLHSDLVTQFCYEEVIGDPAANHYEIAFCKTPKSVFDCLAYQSNAAVELDCAAAVVRNQRG